MVSLAMAMRPWQWVKNLFVLAPLVFAHRLTDPLALGRGAAGAFVAFCAASSAVYLLNDVRRSGRGSPPSAEALAPDRQRRAWRVRRRRRRGRPDRRRRASLARRPRGAASRSGSASTSRSTCSIRWRLKHVVILDVMTIASGFVLRVVAGAAAIAVPVSNWLLLCTTFLSLFLAFSKRRHELALLAGAAPPSSGGCWRATARRSSTR